MGRTPKNMPRYKITMRLELTGMLKDKFDYLKQKYGATTNKSLIEIIITEKYEELKLEDKFAEYMSHKDITSH